MKPQAAGREGEGKQHRSAGQRVERLQRLISVYSFKFLCVKMSVYILYDRELGDIYLRIIKFFRSMQIAESLARNVCRIHYF